MSPYLSINRLIIIKGPEAYNVKIGDIKNIDIKINVNKTIPS